MSMKLYALVDACNAPDFLEMLNTYDPPASCLYNDPLQEGMAERAPYIVELTSEPVKTWLASLTTPWGLYLITDKVNFLEMRKHLRHYTFAMVPIEKKPVFFRFYDPRVFWDLTTKILDDWQLHAFLGPIDIVATYFDGQYRQDHFEARRAQFPNLIKMKSKFLTFSESQYDQFNQIYEARYIDELATHMMQYVDPSIIENAEQNAERIHREMLEHERTIKGAEITHAADHGLLLTGTQQPDTKPPQTQRVEQAYFNFSRKTGEWQKIRGSDVTKVGFVVSQALTKIAKTPISENDFHEQTNFEYVYLTKKEEAQILSNRAKQNSPNNGKNNSSTVNQNVPHRNDPDYLKSYHEQPYFYEQNKQWFYVDDAGYAHPIRDERTKSLSHIDQQKIFEDEFHQRTQNRYQEYEGLAYLPEIIEEEDILEITTMDELKETIHEFARDLVDYFESQNIFHNPAFKKLSKLFVMNGYYRLKDLPDQWINFLEDNGDGAKYRARMLELAIKKEMKILGSK